MQILYAALVLGGMGMLFGVLLTAASKVFAVPSNPKKDAVTARRKRDPREKQGNDHVKIR